VSEVIGVHLDAGCLICWINTRRETMLEYLTLEKVISLAEQAVQEKGSDFIYKQMECSVKDEDDLFSVQTTCAYVHEDDVPGCLVGNILVRHGVQPSKFEELGINVDTGSDEALRTLISSGVIVGVSESASEFLELVQRHQDGGFTWGYAVEETLQAHHR